MNFLGFGTEVLEPGNWSGGQDWGSLGYWAGGQGSRSRMPPSPGPPLHAVPGHAALHLWRGDLLLWRPGKGGSRVALPAPVSHCEIRRQGT